MRLLFPALSRRYRLALVHHLRAEHSTSSNAILRIVRMVVALGLEASQLVLIHKHALASMNSSGSRSSRNRRAKGFLTLVNTGLKEARRVIGSETKRFLASEDVTFRRALERQSPWRRDHRGKTSTLLRESLRAQESLRQLTHRNIEAQERERHALSRQLQGGVAQALLGVHVRLVNLRRAARANKTSLTKEVARTQQLVEESTRSINRLARDLSSLQPA